MSTVHDGSSGCTPIRIGVSACLLGEPVRDDGGHTRDRWLTDVLGRFVEWVPICPEVEMGIGTPREAIQLDGANLSGYVLKNDSPGCGLFAAALTEHFPTLPIEEEGRLRDPARRENWVTRVFVYHRLQRLWRGPWSVNDLVGFHTAHKLLLLAHAPQAYQELGRLVANAGRVTSGDVRTQYEHRLMSALATRASRGRHVNVLQHIVGYFRDRLDACSRHELLSAIDAYRRGLSPHAVPLALVAHYVRVFHISYLEGQVYLVPYPKELSLP